MGANYLNIELEVRAPFDLQQLRDAFGDGLSLNYCGETEPGSFLLAGGLAGYDGPNPSPNTTATGLCELIESLPESAKALWIRADDRVLDVGLEANFDRQVTLNLLTPETAGRIANVGARLAVSVYATHLENELKR